MNEYRDVQKRLASGWNTWDTRSVLSHVLLPDALCIRLGIKNYATSSFLKEAFVLRRLQDPAAARNQAQVLPGPHAYDGSYTQLRLTWQDIVLDVRSAHDGDDLVILVEPVEMTAYPATLVAEAGILYNRPGWTANDGDCICASLQEREIRVFCTGKRRDEPNYPTDNPHFACVLSEPVCIATGHPRSIEEARMLLCSALETHTAASTRYGELAELHKAMQTILAWDTIYEPKKGRVCTPVSRKWNMNWGGYVLFDWDTYFAGWMASVDNPDLAVANAVEISHERSHFGFIPNFAADENNVSDDRSQPPVGSLTVLAILDRYGPSYTWLVHEVFNDLLSWNRWWPEARQVSEGLLAWGCGEKLPSTTGHWAVSSNYSDLQGAAWESGLDNSPMYDDVPFDTKRRVLLLEDAGLTALYVSDCKALAELAGRIGRKDEEAELLARGKRFENALAGLWNEDGGIFQNRRTDTDVFSDRLSPTLFYPLLSGSASPEQARIMMERNFFNPDKFWGEYIMPSIAHDDPAYPDQEYWRGRIWAPMNFLVYLGLRRYDLPEARKAMAQKSAALLLKEWRAFGHIHENYNGDTGEGCDVTSSDSFYHWGGLLALIPLMEAGFA
ncbi:MAG TPA: trehalase family glycosidase [Clostridia bacterium]